MRTGEVGRLKTRAPGLGEEKQAGLGGSGSVECREPGPRETPGEEEREFSSRAAGRGARERQGRERGRPGTGGGGAGIVGLARGWG